MTTTSTFSGISDEAKTSSRILKPPGGGSSNIFAAGEAKAPPKPRGGVSKPAESGVFNSSDAASKNTAQRSARDGDDSFKRLFGDLGSLSSVKKNGTSASQYVNTHSNLFGSFQQISKPHMPGTDSTHDHIFGENAIAGHGEAPGIRFYRGQGHYNPITGADYKDLAPNHHALHVKELPKAQKEQPPLPCSDERYQAKSGKMQNVQTSTRVTNPPGGKTHKLW